jgi:hypothetical protein
MLYDPKWKRETVVDLAAWLETKPADAAYNFLNYGSCLIAEWMEGVEKDCWALDVKLMYHGWDKACVARGKNNNTAEWTYGAALARARAALAAGAE